MDLEEYKNKDEVDSTELKFDEVSESRKLIKAEEDIYSGDII